MSIAPCPSRSRKLVPRLAISAWLLLISCSSATRAAEAVAAQDFLNSIGVCTHVGQGADDPAKSGAALAYAGIRNIRDDASDRHVDDWIAMHKQSGVKVVLTQSGPTGAAIPRVIEMNKKLAGAGALLALEGPNEPNNWPVTFEGQKSGKTTSLPIAKWQAAFYAAAKSDSVLKDYPVFHSSEAGGSEPDNVGLQFLTIPQGASDLMPAGTKFADYANVHNYICRKPAIIDNMAWINADPTFHGWTDALYVEYGKTWRNNYPGYTNEQLQTLPRVTTETGWVTGGDKGLTQDQQGRLYLNLYLAQFARGYKYTFVYMLKDAGGSDAGYGIVDQEYKPKKSAEYLHNLTTILANNPSSKVTRTPPLKYTILNQPDTVHTLLLRKESGQPALIVWNERASGSDAVAINTSGESNAYHVYDPTIGIEAVKVEPMGGTLTVTLSDHPVIIEQ